MTIHFLNKKKVNSEFVVHSDPQPSTFKRSDFESRDQFYEFIGKTLIRDIFK
jgi:hypothetical protein